MRRWQRPSPRRGRLRTDVKGFLHLDVRSDVDFPVALGDRRRVVLADPFVGLDSEIHLQSLYPGQMGAVLDVGHGGGSLSRRYGT
ncbi:hypothetical protein GCM10020254_05680 [Streptomyces goshikiensis]